ncbi:MAG: phospho-sugar mutase [Spirochaetes bacterium]|nr:MAG: phospho-sugar mutase [Spirochaetota bacterium]
MNLVEEYLEYEENEYFIRDLKKVVDSGDKEELHDRFYTSLVFGTGGLRGKIGGGYNRMNPYIVRKATQGLSNYVKRYTSNGSAVIAYDSRNFSKVFAEEAARIFCSNGIKTYLFTSLRPTPVLSFAVRQLKATTGVVVTASHNPAVYNGYKVYWEDGGQIVPPHDKAIIDEVNAVSGRLNPLTLEEAEKKGLLEYIDSVVDEPFVKMVKECSIRPELMKEKGKDLKIVYTPLHGAGRVMVERTLSEMGIKVITVPEQREPDGNFPTVEFPNPEIASAMKLGIELSLKESADMLMGTDPDSDRLGIAVPENGTMVLVTGNQLGVLLADYIFSSLNTLGKMPENGAFVKTIVTTDLQKLVAESFGVKVYDVLTGFKYIAEKIKEFEKTGEKYIFGGEESYGFLVTDRVRDKDAVSAAFLAVEMALYHRTKGKSVLDRLKEIWTEYGYFEELLISRYFEGQKGKDIMDSLMDSLRQNPPELFGGIPVEKMIDYKSGETVKAGENRIRNIDLPPSNVLQFFLIDGSKITVRPSGTEPKIKFYASCRVQPGVSLEESKREASGKLEAIEKDIDKLL